MTPAGLVLLKAWEAWDEHPRAEHLVTAMEQASRQFAGNEPTLVLRRFLAGARRRGASRHDAISAWEELHE